MCQNGPLLGLIFMYEKGHSVDLQNPALYIITDT